MAKSIAFAADASRLPSLLLGYIPAVCALVAPRQPDASTAIIDRLSHSRALTAIPVPFRLQLVVEFDSQKTGQAMFEDALPPDFAIESGDPREPAQLLFAEETSQIASAVERRRLEFARGRHCARAALRRLGVPDAPLLNGNQREPLWPAAVVGSITHTEGLCVAAVALRRSYVGVGIDVELDEPLLPAVAEHVATAAEMSSLHSMSNLVVARLVFSAKEAFYKCQFYRTRQFLGFFDVSIELQPEGEFAVELMVAAGSLARGERFHGRWRQRGGFLFTAVHMQR